MNSFDRIKAFRQEAYNYLCRGRDATFELTDAIILTRKAYSKRGLVPVSSISTQVVECV